MSFDVRPPRGAARRQLDSLSVEVRMAFVDEVMPLLVDRPGVGKVLTKEPFTGDRRLFFYGAQYRVVYRIEGDTVEVLRIGPRSTIYGHH